MQNILEDLTKLLSKEEKYSSDGRMLKNVIVEDALKLEPFLIKLLLSDKKTKKHFFQDIEGTYVFDKIKFQKFISNKQFLPDSYTAFKNKIGLTTDDEYITEKKDVVLSWPYKDCMLEGGQDKEDAKREEIFWNETLAPDEIDRLLSPKVLTNWKKYDKDGEHKVEEVSEKDNLIIKGNNLLGLSSILKKYRGMVKLIYIDPPYYFNQLTATDSFKYNSNFHLSTWLVFMKDRLKLAKKLLTTGGTIWINISEDGMHYLKVLADAIFGSDHFIGTIPRRTRSGKSDVPFNFSQDFDWILVYTNVEESNSVVGREVQRDYYETVDYPGRPWRLADLTSQQPANKRPNSYFTMKDPKTGKEYPASEKRTWALTKDTFDYYYQKGAIVFPDDYDFLNITKPYARKFKDDDDSSGKLSSVISDFLIQDFLKAVLNESKNMDGNSQIDSMFGRDAFDYAKPENLIKSVLEVATTDNDLVLDFFLGSGTTCAVAHKLGRRYIGIEQMDYIERLSVERLKQVISGDQVGISNQVNWQGGGSFIFCELVKANHEYIDKINEAKDSKSLLKIWKTMQDKAFISYKIDIKTINISIADFEELPVEDQKRFLIETLDKNMLYVPYSEIDDTDYSISIEDKKLNHIFYGGKA